MRTGPLDDSEDEAGGELLSTGSLDPLADIHSEIPLIYLGSEFLNHVVALVSVDVGTHPVVIGILHKHFNVSEVTASGTCYGCSSPIRYRRSSATRFLSARGCIARALYI